MGEQDHPRARGHLARWFTDDPYDLLDIFLAYKTKEVLQ
jgi:hypothetical protein